jgi:hypothetical protein
LAEGGAADCVVVDAGRIVHVVVAGRPVVGDGQLLSGDWEHITAQAKEQAARLWLRMGSQ